ncbi:MAG: hypothetical protein AB1925_12370 [Actinomycetota bacterium]
MDYSSVWGRMPAPDSYVAMQFNSDGTAVERRVVDGQVVAERAHITPPDHWPTEGL